MADVASGSIHLTNQASIILPVTLVSADETQSVACEWRADPDTNQCGLYRVSDDAMLWGGIVLSDGTSGTVTSFLKEPGTNDATRVGIHTGAEEYAQELVLYVPTYEGTQNDYSATGEKVVAWMAFKGGVIRSTGMEPVPVSNFYIGEFGAIDELRLRVTGTNGYTSVARFIIGDETDAPEFRLPAVLQISSSYKSQTLADLMPYCKLSAPTSESLTYSSSTPCWVYDYKTVGLNDDGQYDLLLGGSGGKRQMGWIVPANGWYRVFLHARLTGGSSSKALMYVAVLPSTWTPPTVNYLALATLTDDADQLINNASLPISATNTYGDMVAEFYATAGKKIWPTVAMNDATKTIVTAESWASIQRIG
jgi:hypothetical protein